MAAGAMAFERIGVKLWSRSFTRVVGIGIHCLPIGARRTIASGCTFRLSKKDLHPAPHPAASDDVEKQQQEQGEIPITRHSIPGDEDEQQTLVLAAEEGGSIPKHSVKNENDPPGADEEVDNAEYPVPGFYGVRLPHPTVLRNPTRFPYPEDDDEQQTPVAAAKGRSIPSEERCDRPAADEDKKQTPFSGRRIPVNEERDLPVADEDKRHKEEADGAEYPLPGSYGARLCHPTGLRHPPRYPYPEEDDQTPCSVAVAAKGQSIPVKTNEGRDPPAAKQQNEEVDGAEYPLPGSYGTRLPHPTVIHRPPRYPYPEDDDEQQTPVAAAKGRSIPSEERDRPAADEDKKQTEEVVDDGAEYPLPGSYGARLRHPTVLHRAPRYPYPEDDEKDESR